MVTMKQLYSFLVLFVVCAGTVNSQTNKTFFLGHSLINFHTPNMVNKLSIAAANSFSYDANIGIGSNLQNHWNNPASGQGSPWISTLPTGGFEHFILTEAVPLLPHLQWSNTYRYADSLYQYALQANPAIQYYIYETWHCTTTGTPTGCEWDNDDSLLWRPRLTADLALWEGIADSINLIHNREMLIIPAGQAMGRLHDSIVANSVPGITSMSQLFVDDIHLSFTGIYFIACVMYGVIHKESPLGLPNQLTDEWGLLYTDYPTVAQAEVMQRIAWSTLCDYPRDGVDCSVLSNSEMSSTMENRFSIFPNPAKDKLTVTGSLKINTLELMNLSGQRVLFHGDINASTFEVNLANLTSGIYFLHLHSNEGLFSQKLIVE